MTLCRPIGCVTFVCLALTWTIAGCAGVTGGGSTAQVTRAATIPPRPLPTVGRTPTATLAPAFSLEPGDHLIGEMEAPVVLLTYLDFQCRYCAGVGQALRQLQAAHARDASLVYRPLVQEDLHDKSMLAAAVAEAAGRQGAFWEMFDALYAGQDEWIDLTAGDFLDWSAARAEAIGLERTRFSTDVEDPEIEASIEAAATRASRAGVPGAPVLYLNGAVFQPPPTPINLEASLRLELLIQRQYASYPEIVIDPAASYHAWLRFDGFEMRVELYPEAAPLAVNNFVFLSREGWYDGSPVHRVLPGILFETGDPSGTGLGGPGYNFPTETAAGFHFDRAGRVAMSSVGPGTNGSQFFITLSAQPALDGSRTIFGQVVEGLEAAADWEARESLLDLLEPPPAVLEEIEIVEE